MWRPKKPLNVTWVSIINSCKSEIRLAADYIVNETLAREGLNPVRTKHSLPPSGVFVTEGGSGEGRKKARGGQWKGKERKWGSRLFTLPTVQRALAFFIIIIAVFIGIPSESLCRWERTKHVAFSFLLKYPLSCYNCLCYSNPLGAECMGPSRWLKEPRCQYVHNSEKSVAIKILVLLQP